MATSAYTDDLTLNEAAHLAGVSVRKVEKSCEEGIVNKKKYAGYLVKREVFHVPAETVVYTAALKNCANISPNKTFKKRLWRFLRASRKLEGSFGVANLGEGLLLDLDAIAGTAWSHARFYMAARDKHLTSDPEIFGGEAIIKGTRITCRSVKGRVDAGDTLDDLVEDYDDEISKEAFDVALTYANSHPVRGRPGAGKPWR